MPPEAPALTSLGDALVRFAFPDSSVQTSRHILALHWYVACRLVIEGGLDPDRIRPRPPITVERTRYGTFLHHDPGAAKPGERTILGGLKTKKVDVTVTIPTIGPALAVSLKGSHNAFRNLTNRMEEAAGDCTNPEVARTTAACTQAIPPPDRFLTTIGCSRGCTPSTTAASSTTPRP